MNETARKMTVTELDALQMLKELCQYYKELGRFDEAIIDIALEKVIPYVEEVGK